MIVIMDIITVLSLGMLGLVFGSFAGAHVWRLRAWQLEDDRRVGEVIDDKKEYKRLLPLTKTTVTSDRSRCLACGHELAWFDLLPLVSWVLLGGRCRYCHVKIGTFEPIMEMSVACFFVVSYLLWPQSLDISMRGIEMSHVVFTLWLIAGVLLAILFAYDYKWFLLPDSTMVGFILVASLISLIQIVQSSDISVALLNLTGALCILSGIYYVLWLVSRGELIGFGDIKLGFGLALLLSDWRLAFFALFLANALGCLLVLPGLLRGKVDRKTRIPFGPLLIVGAVLAYFTADQFMNWLTGVYIVF
jgi:prepilin signal peptidase PulO-like enzyme (type II secretory pathway)